MRRTAHLRALVGICPTGLRWTLLVIMATFPLWRMVAKFPEEFQKVRTTALLRISCSVGWLFMLCMLANSDPVQDEIKCGYLYRAASSLQLLIVQLLVETLGWDVDTRDFSVHEECVYRYMFVYLCMYRYRGEPFHDSCRPGLTCTRGGWASTRCEL